MTAHAATAVQREIVLPVARERAWEAITDPRQLACWLADEVALDPRPGGAAAFRWDDGSARSGVVEECVDQRRLTFRWRDDEQGEESLVEIALDEVEQGTRVSVLELPLTPTADAPMLAAAGTPSTWGPRIARLSACCALAWA